MTSGELNITQNKPVIREYTPADKENVLALLRLNIPKYFAPKEEKDLADYLENERESYFVMELNGALLGCGGFNISDDGTTGKISWDFFHPAHQGKGLGARLLRFRIEKLKEYPSIKTISVRTSQLAYRFYQKQGFEIRETVNDYWAEGFDMIRMECVVRQ